MGVVYRARQNQPDRLVALKVIAPELAEDVTFRARFGRESAVAAEIEHPNVIPVYAVGEDRGVLFIAMRFVDGIDLSALLAQSERLEPRRAAMIIDQVGQALDAAHHRGLVHRDVKPANILLSTAGGREHVYLTDFGLSRHIDRSQAMTQTGAFLGTIDYVAPEQVRGGRVDALTDVYSLGCVLFESLTGSVPYPLDNDFAKLYAHDNRPPPSVCERAPDVPEAFDAVLVRAMAKSPEQRYLSAGDLGRAALAAASDTSLSRTERSVATGAAAPQEAAAVPTQGIPTVADNATVPEPPAASPVTASPAMAPTEASPPPTEASPPPTDASPPPTEESPPPTEASPPPGRPPPPGGAAAAPPSPTPARRPRRRMLAGLLAIGGLAAAAGLVIVLSSGSSPNSVSSTTKDLAAIGLPPPPSFGSFKRCHLKSDVVKPVMFVVCYRSPNDAVVLAATRMADSSHAQIGVNAAISDWKNQTRSPVVHTQDIGGVTYTSISGPNVKTLALGSRVIWQSFSVFYQLDSINVDGPAVIAIADQAQRATEYS
jgi:serine/threonine protein kinase